MDAVISGADTQNPTATNVTDGEVFTVVVMNASGGTDSCTVDAIVNPNPVCAAENSGPICSGEELQLAETGGEGLSWEWSSDGNAIIADPFAQNTTATNVSDGEVFKVIITNDNGCMSMCETVAEVFPDPNCNAINNGPICAGDTLMLLENGGDAVSWSWSSNGTAMIFDADTDAPYATNVSNGEEFTVEITDANGCTSSCTTVAEVVDPPMVEASNNGPICVGDLLWLQASVSGGMPPYSYQWSHPNGFTANTASVFISDATILDEGPYTLEVTDAMGCTASATTLVEINFNLTNPGLIGGDEYFCGPGFDPGVIFEVMPPSGAPGVIDYFWMMKVEGGEWEIIPGADGPTYDPGPIYETTQYSRCVRIDGCVMALESNVVTKTVGTEAIADPVGPASPCVDEIAVYSVTEQAGATYAWNFGSGATPPTANTHEVEVTWSSFGLRMVTVTVTTATCTANNFLYVNVSDDPTYCADFAGNGQVLKAYPNPFNDQVEITLAQEVRTPAMLRVQTLQGATLSTVPVPTGTLRMDLELNELPSGVYILSLDLGVDGVYFEKVVKR